jgi:NCS1 family nucleobase:cation symporter-1
MDSTKERDAGGLEVHHIDVVDPSERHGKARDLFAVWLSANVNIGNAIFGALAVIVGNSPFWALVAVLVGNALGGAFMALHSAQGPKLGVPQLIQSRGQFGYYGALLPVALAVLLYGGFFVVTAIIGGQALTAAIPALPQPVAIVLVSLVSIVLALIGYRAIHTAARLALWPLAISVLVVGIASIRQGGVDLTPTGFAWGPFLTAVGITATFLLTYAPYVSDYSRYLPEDTSVRGAFGWTFAGAYLGTVLTEIVGVALAAQFADSDTMTAVGQVLGGGPLAAVVLLVGALAIGGNNALNLYGGMLNLITAASSVATMRPRLSLRVGMLLPTFVIGLAVALSASNDFVTNLNNFLSFLMLGFVPWGAINLLDFYLVRRGHYDVPAFFTRSGVYYDDPATWTRRGVNWQAVTAYVVGVAAALPFVSNAWYQGALTGVFGGADVSWIPGLLVTGVLYLVLSRNARVPATGTGSPVAGRGSELGTAGAR